MGTQVLVLHYGYAEESLCGYDIWVSMEGYYEDSWGALRSLAHWLLQFYLGEQEGWERMRPKGECCKGWENTGMLAGGQKPNFCPECGRRFERSDFNVEHFASWIKEVYARPNHELPNFWEYEEEWSNYLEFSVLLSDYDAADFFEVREHAGRVLASALDVKELPEGSRADFIEQTKFWFKCFDEGVQQAYFEFEEKCGRTPNRKTAWEEDDKG
jgi:hypothetical protein